MANKPNGFDDGQGILRALNAGLTHDVQNLRASFNQIAMQNQTLIAILRGIIGKYSTTGSVVLTDVEVSRVCPTGQVLAIHIKKIGQDKIMIALDPGGATEPNESERRIITLGEEH